jgi:hypothetical protein
MIKIGEQMGYGGREFTEGKGPTFFMPRSITCGKIKVLSFLTMVGG